MKSESVLDQIILFVGAEEAKRTDDHLFLLLVDL